MADVYAFNSSKDALYKKGEIKEAPKMTHNQYLLTTIREMKSSQPHPLFKDLDPDR